MFETLYLHLQEEYGLFLPRKPCPRSWRTYSTSRFRASNWEDVPLLDQIDRKIFSVHCWEKAHLSVRKMCRTGAVFSSFTSGSHPVPGASPACSLGCYRAMASLNFRRGPWHSSPPRSNKEHVAHRIKGKQNISR